MHDIQVTLKLPSTLLHAAEGLAKARRDTVGNVVRDALGREIRRATRTAKTPNREEEHLLGPLRALLAADLAEARSWPDLQARLMAKGCQMRARGGGLVLHNHCDGLRLCKASELGYGYAALMRRFGKPFPGHAHHGLEDRILGKTDVIDDRDMPDRRRDPSRRRS